MMLVASPRGASRDARNVTLGRPACEKVTQPVPSGVAVGDILELNDYLYYINNNTNKL